jgi:hypothetical protein
LFAVLGWLLTWWSILKMNSSIIVESKAPSII